jgi:uncharacterized protein with HEPN domain
MKDPKLYLLHIAECIARIERYTAGGLGALEGETLILDAVLRNLQTLSEATQRLPDEVKARYGDIPWQRIAGFRNILVHDYLGDLDTGIVWRVIETELPVLKAAITAELGR